MADRSKIAWTDATWNPVTGCTPVSDGCSNCYAARYANRGIGDFQTCYDVAPGMDPIMREFFEVRCHPERLGIPLRWRKPRKIFVCSMGDLFHALVPDEFIEQVFKIAEQCSQHTFQILTKRPRRMQALVSSFQERAKERYQVPKKILNSEKPYQCERCGNGFMTRLVCRQHREKCEAACNNGQWDANVRPSCPLPNVWLGVTAENQHTADERIPLLLHTPAAVRFVSCEPMLGSVNLMTITIPDGDGHGIDLTRIGEASGIGWVICGGETGPGARYMHPDWARRLRDECQAASVPFFFKQWGEYCWPSQMSDETWRMVDAQVNLSGIPDGRHRVGKRSAGRLLDGREWNEFPGRTSMEMEQ